MLDEYCDDGVFTGPKCDYETLLTLFNESYSKEGVKQDRVPYGRAAVVWHDHLGEWKYVAIGNAVLCRGSGSKVED